MGGSPVSIAFGFDESSQYFLSVFDKRLEIKDGVSEEVNKVAMNVGIKDGGGSYFDLHTGTKGFGMKVSNDTMKCYLSRFGVPKAKIDDLFSGKYSKTKPELADDLEKLKIPKSDDECEKCGCAKEWVNHKSICDALPFPVKNTQQKSFYGIYLPEDGERPVLVLVPIKQMYDDYFKSNWDLPLYDSFLGKNTSPSDFYWTRNMVNQKRIMRNKLIITYRDDFLIDGTSKDNQVVKKITKGKVYHNWKGPILIMKGTGVTMNPTENYLDIQTSDFPDIVDFFMWYGNNN